MLYIQVIDKDRFMHQVKASQGGVFLHLEDGTVCNLKQDHVASALLQQMEAPSQGLAISLENPADVNGFFRYMLEAGRQMPQAC